MRSYSFRVICEIIRSVHELIVMNREQFTQILLLNVSLFAHSRSLNRAFFALHSHTLTMSVYSRRESSCSPGSDSYVVLCRPTCACQRGSATRVGKEISADFCVRGHTYGMFADDNGVLFEKLN